MRRGESRKHELKEDAGREGMENWRTLSHYAPREYQTRNGARVSHAQAQLAYWRDLGLELTTGGGDDAKKRPVHHKANAATLQNDFWKRHGSKRIASTAPTGASTGFVPPLDFKSAVTGTFAEDRGNALHRGTDLRAPEGSPVHAPSAALVHDVAVEKAGGLYVVLGLQRPDGGFADQTTAGDDSGLVVTFAHLSQASVKPGDTVKAGDVIGKTGATGQDPNGNPVPPHLHVAVEYVHDAQLMSFDSNARVFIDPSGVYGSDAALTGNAPSQLHRAGQTFPGEVEAKPGNELAPSAFSAFGATAPGPHGTQPISITIGGNGAVSLGSGNATNVSTSLKPVFQLMGSEQGNAVGSVDPIPEGLRNIIRNLLPAPLQSIAFEVLARGGPILEGIGSDAGKFFRGVITPQNGVTVVSGIGSAAQIAAGLASGIGAVAGFAAPIVAGVGPETGPAAPVLEVVAAVLEAISAAAGPVSGVLGIAGEGLQAFGNVARGALGLPALPRLPGLPDPSRVIAAFDPFGTSV